MTTVTATCSCSYVFPYLVVEHDKWGNVKRVHTLDEMLNTLMCLAVRQHGYEVDFISASYEDKWDVQDALANGAQEITWCKEAITHLTRHAVVRFVRVTPVQVPSSATNASGCSCGC